MTNSVIKNRRTLSESKKKYERDVTRKATGFKSMQLAVGILLKKYKNTKCQPVLVGFQHVIFLSRIS